MFDGIDMNQFLEKAKKLQNGLSEKKKEAEKKTVEVSVGGGMVTLVMNGKMELLSIKLDPEIVDKNDIETLEDLVRCAVNEGIKKSKREMTSLIGIPGLDIV